MEVVERIKKCKDDEQLYWLTKKLIKEATKESKELNGYRGLIGTKSEINRKECDFDPNKKERYSFSVPFWDGYIPLGTKIVYGIACGKQFTFDSNCGYYYYVDDDSYVYDFIKYVKDWDIEDIFDLVSLINGFSRKLFDNYFEPKNRVQMHKLLLKEDYVFYEPIKEHSIKDFYGTGSAQCTEYALIASNLLSIFKIPVFYCMDTTHAFNVVFDETEENDYEGYILDYSHCAFAYDEMFNYIGRYPFYEKIETKERKFIILSNDEYVEVQYDKSEEQIQKEERFYDEFVNEGKRVQVNDFSVEIINGHMFKATKDNIRDYGIECNNKDEKKVLVKKREKGSIVL